MIKFESFQNFFRFALIPIILAFSWVHLTALQTDACPGPQAVTYEMKGRMGNLLITYINAKWISYKYNIPLLYIPFTFSDQFLFHEKEKFYLSDWESTFKYKIQLVKTSDISKNLDDSTLFVVPYFYDPLASNKKKKPRHSLGVDWSDLAFRQIVQDLIQPLYPIKTLDVKANKLNVLVHVRMGGGYDSEKTKLRFPRKFPPQSFYISALEKLSELFGHPDIYAFIMTDDPNPAQLAKSYRTSLSHLQNIEFDYRKGKNGPSNNVIEDFFSIPKFDCLIRPDSTFSVVASYLTDFKAIIYPKSGHIENEKAIIDSIEIQLEE